MSHHNSISSRYLRRQQQHWLIMATSIIAAMLSIPSWSSMGETVVEACERPYAVRPIGPFFNTFPPGAQLSHIPFLWTTSSDENILLGTLTMWNNETEYIGELNVTITLPEGMVTTGWPDDAVPTMPPERLADPTGGYELVVVPGGGGDDTTTTTAASSTTKIATLVQKGAAGGVVSSSSWSIDLELPVHYVYDLPTVDEDEDYYYFVDRDNNVAIVLYSGYLLCQNATMVDYRCTDCPECIWDQNFAAALDLSTGATIVTGYQHDAFIQTIGFVWGDTVRVATVGELNDSCGIQNYLSYNPVNGSVYDMKRFDPTYLYATTTNVDDDRYVVYTIEQVEYYSYGPEDANGEESPYYVTEFVVQKFNMQTGEIISTTTLDLETLWAFTGMEVPPGEEEEEENTPTPMPAIPPKEAVPTLAPVTATTRVPTSAPVSVVVPTLVPVMVQATPTKSPVPPSPPSTTKAPVVVPVLAAERTGKPVSANNDVVVPPIPTPASSGALINTNGLQYLLPWATMAIGVVSWSLTCG